jgi:anti-anti-sigma factor
VRVSGEGSIVGGREASASIVAGGPVSAEVGLPVVARAPAELSTPAELSVSTDVLWSGADRVAAGWWPLCRIPGPGSSEDQPIAEVWARHWPGSGDGASASVALTGELSLATVPRIWESLEWVSGVAERLDVDVSAVTFLDASGVALLSRLAARLGERRCALRVRPANPLVSRMLQLFDLDFLLGGKVPVPRA